MAATSWFRPVPLLTNDGIPVAVPGDSLAGLDLYEVDVSLAAAGSPRRRSVAVHDRRAATVSAAMRVDGDGQFALLDDREQASVGPTRWGGALAGFARERCQVVRDPVGRTGQRRCPVQDQIGRLERVVGR